MSATCLPAGDDIVEIMVTAIVARVTPRTRVALVVAVTAASASALTVGATVLTKVEREPPPSAADRPPSRPPPLALDLGVRTDPVARALRRAETLYARGRRAEARRVFTRYRDAQAQVGAALASWPRETVARLRRLTKEHPRSAVVRLHLGLALAAEGRGREAREAWRSAERAGPDSASAVRAEGLLHPRFAPWVPIFTPSFAAGANDGRLSAARRVAAIARSARDGGPREKMLYGVVLQQLGRRLSAERVFSEAARMAPSRAEPQVAAAVGRFRKARPERAFSRLGPLARRFPRAATVRFHLGLLLLWSGEPDAAKRQLALAGAARPNARLAREAKRLLARLSP